MAGRRIATHPSECFSPGLERLSDQFSLRGNKLIQSGGPTAANIVMNPTVRSKLWLEEYRISVFATIDTTHISWTFKGVLNGDSK